MKNHAPDQKPLKGWIGWTEIRISKEIFSDFEIWLSKANGGSTPPLLYLGIHIRAFLRYSHYLVGGNISE
jgi:hypothetical protein